MYKHFSCDIFILCIRHLLLLFCYFLFQTTSKMELIDLRILNYLRKSEISVERILVCNAIEKIVEHGILLFAMLKNQ